jgi:hypoxanthine phosphoribosyltransferase
MTLEKEVLIPRDTIQKRVKEIANQISSDYKGRELVLIGILNGVVFFFADLVREISIPTKIDFIRAQGKPVVVVEDIVDTGLTLTHIVKDLEDKGIESLRICALIDKFERRDAAISIDYCGFQIEEGFIVGYGLDYNEKYRHLPDICVLR